MSGLRVVGHLRPPVSRLLRVKAPDFERVLGEPNPFPPDHRLHEIWEVEAQKAATAAAALLAELTSTATEAMTWGEVLDWQLAWLTGLFDIRARAFRAIEGTPRAYRRILEAHAEAILAHVRIQRLPNGEELVEALAARLQRRLVVWVGDAYAAHPVVQQAALPTPEDLKQKRAALLDAFKRKHGVQSDAAVYDDERSCIHKPDFYTWKRGKLPPGSATALNFERYLESEAPAGKRKR